MTHNPRLEKILTHWFIAVMLLALTACNQNETNDEQRSAPQIPPDFTMSVTKDFPSNTGSAQAGTVTALTTNHYSYAAFNVLFWNSVLVVNLAVPVAAFLESFHHFPTLRSNDTWVWTYAVRLGGVIYTAELHAQVYEDFVHWNMYVTKPGEYLDFNWFSGLSARDGSNGNWTLRKDPTNPTEYLDIEWTYDKANQTGTAQYTVVLEGDPQNGSYIYYGSTEAATYDAFYDVYNAGNGHLLEIEWNRTSRAGRVRNPDYFPDAEWRYWDENLQDIPAP